MNRFDVVVIGAGITGLSVANALSRESRLKIALLDQFATGHPFGGSHGTSRIFRSIYAHPAYLQLIQRALRYEWPELEKELGQSYLHPTSCCTFGRGPTFKNYLDSLKDSPIDILDLPEARRLFPQFRFPNIEAVLHDRTGGVLAAQDLIGSLKTNLLKKGVELKEETKVLSLNFDEDPICIKTNRGELSAHRLIVAAGAWMPKLISSLQSLIVPIRQTVGYFNLQGSQENQFPNWSFIGEENLLFYGLPEFQSSGIKISRHVTSGKEDDPDQLSQTADPTQVAILESFIREHFVQAPMRLVKSESCFYANAPKEGFILDLLPNDPRIVIGSACSGHGFKFAPLTGKILAQLSLHGKTSIPEFEEFKSLFSIPRPAPPALCHRVHDREAPLNRGR